jgi:hypothetical protein
MPVKREWVVNMATSDSICLVPRLSLPSLVGSLGNENNEVRVATPLEAGHETRFNIVARITTEGMEIVD